MNWSPAEQASIRQDVFRWLERQEIEHGGYEFRRQFLRSAYSYQGRVIPLMDAQTGIWNPTGFDATLSITMTLNGPYADEVRGAIQRYSYERLANRPLISGRNLKLRAAAASGAPLILFREVLRSLYVPQYPVFIVRDDPAAGYVEIALDESLTLFGDPLDPTPDQRRYVEQVVKVRLHQKYFRSRVLHAYRAKCAICALAHPELLDAAHITPDGVADSTASVTNGLALCKIHHAAYDRKLIGIDGDYRVHVRDDLLAEDGGPMLTHGIQAMDGRTLLIPHQISERPSRERLEHRYLEFAAHA